MGDNAGYGYIVEQGERVITWPSLTDDCGAVKKDSIVILLDVGPSMSPLHPKYRCSHLELALSCIRLLVHHKAIFPFIV